MRHSYPKSPFTLDEAHLESFSASCRCDQGLPSPFNSETMPMPTLCPGRAEGKLHAKPGAHRFQFLVIATKGAALERGKLHQPQVFISSEIALPFARRRSGVSSEHTPVPPDRCYRSTRHIVTRLACSPDGLLASLYLARLSVVMPVAFPGILRSRTCKHSEKRSSRRWPGFKHSTF